MIAGGKTRKHRIPNLIGCQYHLSSERINFQWRCLICPLLPPSISVHNLNMQSTSSHCACLMVWHDDYGVHVWWMPLGSNVVAVYMGCATTCKQSCSAMDIAIQDQITTWVIAAALVLSHNEQLQKHLPYQRSCTSSSDACGWWGSWLLRLSWHAYVADMYASCMSSHKQTVCNCTVSLSI